MTRSPSEPKGTTGTALSSQWVITLAEGTAVANHKATAGAANRRICSIGVPLDGDAFLQAIARTGVPLGSEPIGYCRDKLTPGGVLMTTKSDGAAVNQGAHHWRALLSDPGQGGLSAMSAPWPRFIRPRNGHS